MTWRGPPSLASPRRPGRPGPGSDVCLSYTDIDPGIRGRAIGLLARVLYSDLPPDPPSTAPRCSRDRGGRANQRSRPLSQERKVELAVRGPR
jgi:hypothetical protein